MLKGAPFALCTTVELKAKPIGDRTGPPIGGTKSIAIMTIGPGTSATHGSPLLVCSEPKLTMNLIPRNRIGLANTPKMLIIKLPVNRVRSHVLDNRGEFKQL